MRLSAVVCALSGALVVTGCASPAAAAHRHHAAAPAPSPSATTQPVFNTAQSHRTCRDVRAWLPAAWTEDPPHFTKRLITDQVKARGALGTDMAALLDGIIGLPPGQYMGTSTGILAIQYDCSLIGVKITLPRVAPTAACWHRVRAWLHGAVRGDITSIENALAAVGKYSSSNIYVAVTAVHLMAVAAALARQWPIPACADPGRYWRVFLSDEVVVGSEIGAPALDASNGYIPSAAYSEQVRADSAFLRLVHELGQTTGHHPFS